MFQADESLREKQSVMTKLKGVGSGTAGALLAHVPELGTLDRREATALGGLAPHPQESGKWQGKRRIFGGRPAVRKAMYMAARSAAVWCPIIRPFYERLRSAGKSHKQAIIACARKILVRLNTLMKSFHSTTQNPAQAT